MVTEVFDPIVDILGGWVKSVNNVCKEKTDLIQLPNNQLLEQLYIYCLYVFSIPYCAVLLVVSLVQMVTTCQPSVVVSVFWQHFQSVFQQQSLLRPSVFVEKMDHLLLVVQVKMLHLHIYLVEKFGLLGELTMCLCHILRRAKRRLYSPSEKPTKAWSTLSKLNTISAVRPISPTSPKKKGHVRVVCIADTHGLHRSTQVPNGDVLFVAGDLSSCGGLEELIDFNEWIGSLPHRHKIVIAGNHDTLLDEDRYSSIWRRHHLLDQSQYFSTKTEIESTTITSSSSSTTTATATATANVYPTSSANSNTFMKFNQSSAPTSPDYKTISSLSNGGTGMATCSSVFKAPYPHQTARRYRSNNNIPATSTTATCATTLMSSTQHSQALNSSSIKPCPKFEIGGDGEEDNHNNNNDSSGSGGSCSGDDKKQPQQRHHTPFKNNSYNQRPYKLQSRSVSQMPSNYNRNNYGPSVNECSRYSNNNNTFAPGVLPKTVSFNGELSKHNFNSPKEIFTNCTYIQDEGINLYGYKIWGSPWSPRYLHDYWCFTLDRGALSNLKWQSIPRDTEILITHTPPVGIGDLTHENKRSGCVDLLKHVQNRIKPMYHIFGHIHEGHGLYTDGETKYVNASICNLNYKPYQIPITFDLPIKDEVGDNIAFPPPVAAI